MFEGSGGHWCDHDSDIKEQRERIKRLENSFNAIVKLLAMNQDGRPFSEYIILNESERKLRKKQRKRCAYCNTMFEDDGEKININGTFICKKCFDAREKRLAKYKIQVISEGKNNGKF